MKYLFIMFWVWHSCASGMAQTPIHLHLKIIKHGDSISRFKENSFKSIDPFPSDSFFLNRNEVLNFTDRIVDSFHVVGYLACYREIVSETDSSINVRVITGQPFVWTKIAVDHLSFSDIPDKEIEKLKTFRKNWSYVECRQWMNRWLELISDHGYPFVQVYLDSSVIVNNQITSRLNINTGPKVLLDTLEWDSNLKVSQSLLSRIIQISSGAPYSRQAIERINQSLIPYPFIQQYADPDILVAKNLARVKLYLKTQKSSSIDALLGLLPSPDGPLKINGTFRSDFLNQLGKGERLVIDFRSLQSNSQDLNIRASAPFLFQLPFNPFFQFNLYRRDSLFLDVAGEIGASMILGDHSELRFILGQKTSSLLKPDLEQIQRTRLLPVALDLKWRHLGVVFRFNRYDYIRNPRSGFAFQLTLTGSTRAVQPNQSITSLKDFSDTTFSFASLYDPYKKNGFALEVAAELEKFTKLNSYLTWQSKLKSGIKTASTPLQVNEQYRLGGFGLLRGFDEESIFSSDYYLWTNSVRLLTGDLSYLQVFSDLAIVNQFSDRQLKYRTYWGIGTGLVFNTSLGLLSLSVASGRILPDPFDLRNVKLHIGYVNYF